MRRAWWTLPLFVPAATLVPMALFRFLDGDEGDYAAAADLVVDGQVPYRDFLYTQTPLLPYVYGAWGWVAGETWISLRMLSVVFTVALAAILYQHVAARAGAVVALAGLALLSGSTLVFTWYPTAKTYALSTLLLFAAYALVGRVGELARGAAAVAGGLAALSVQTRSLLVGGALVLAWGAWRRRRGGAFAAGFGLALAPSLLLFALDWDRFLFGNFWYHGARSEGGLVGDFQQKAEVVANLLGIATESRPIPQFLLLTVAAVTAGIVLRRARGEVPLALSTAAGLAVIALLPTPSYSQYFATTVPFVLVGVLELVTVARGPFAAAVAATAGAMYLLFAPVEIARLVRSSPEDRPAGVQRVTDYVAARTQPGEEVTTSWAGYVYGTGARPLSGLENAFAPHEADALSASDARKYHVASVADVETAIRSRRTRLVVVKRWHVLPPVPDYDGVARRAGYRLVAQINGARIYEAP